MQGKRIYLPCDNPHQSQFFQYFVKHFKRLGLKRLTATCYDASIGQLSLFEDYDEAQELITKPKQAYKAVIEEVGRSPMLEDLLELPRNHLELLDGNGDFASQECVELMKAADVVVTNPPFSLFRELLRLLVSLDKDYILLGASQAVTYSEAFQRFQMGQLHLGVMEFSKALNFEVPEGTPYDQKVGYTFYKRVPVAWYTSFEVATQVIPLNLTKPFVPSAYPLLDDDDSIINVDRLADLPKDYLGKMAVPITFLKSWDKAQYQLLGKIEKAMVAGQEKFTRLLIQKIKDSEK
ncbi:Modification methylase EcoRI (Adenine-specificmethyltransferase EcoRI) (M.EcoRI) [Lactococcus lactis subsp. lactis A12]|uniref:Modification methylase EcoRI (Adenine-specificmethyltransferase EcoRI) (M.EcoRI) n=1 Tax=Lactococcus lactis subsp. lactis A12 TaxID=1137134 RepID=S6FRP5_LACLL|nr:Modification methylase EcoRI (Adenine-specificmethyltransferase EcoRI) (M.EcoRI) [Lactococcus lactis subsp. lactis A12]SBW29600.1 Modification methylase EcoRI (Adenine-specificmethyltransferase EcoRI) (M.EcoRI) [Lactococcus lactis subsp. lactis]